MNKYEYNCFEIHESQVGGIVKHLNILGEDGWHIYKQEKYNKGLLVWAARKLSKSDGIIPLIKCSTDEHSWKQLASVGEVWGYSFVCTKCGKTKYEGG